MNELDDIIYRIGNRILLETHALLIIQRITSRIDPDPHPFFLRRLLQFGMDWSSSQQYNRMVDVVLLALEPFHSRQWGDVVNHEWCHRFVSDAVIAVLYKLWIKREPPPNTLLLPFDSFMDVINYVTDLVLQLQKHHDPQHNKKAKIFVRFIADSMRMFVENDKETKEEFQKWLADYIKFTNSHPGVYTILHRTCTKCPPMSTIKIIQLFIDGKTDPNVKDEDGDTPLHYLALNKKFPDVAAAATKLLLGVGAHLDQSNNGGITPLDFFNARKTYLDKKGIVAHPYLQKLACTILPLSCLCAQVIRQNSIPFEEKYQLPSHLVPFIQRHSTECDFTVVLSDSSPVEV